LGYVAGGAALRDLGSGNITVHWTGTVVAAFLVWEILDSTTPPANGTFNGASIIGTWVAYATPSPCWSPTYIYTFVADVTDSVKDGVNSLAGFPSNVTNGANPWSVYQSSPLADGASLVVIYEKANGAVRQVTLYLGALTEQGSSITATLNYSKSDNKTAETTYIIADGQDPGNGAFWNGTSIDASAFPGSDPKATSTAWSYGNLSDTKTFNVTVPVGSTNITAGIDSTEGDCMSWSGQVLSVGVRGEAPPYNLSFAEKGLPTGTTWGVTVQGTHKTASTGSAGSVLSFLLGNATYRYTIDPVSGFWAQDAGSVIIKGGDITVVVAFHTGGYAVTFTEAGLASGTAWTVSLDGVSENSTSSTLTFSVPNGTYTYVVGPVAGWVTTNTSGSLVVQGADVARTIPWKAVSWAVTITEQGLPSGTSWSVTLGGNLQTSTSTSIVFLEKNGTYAWSVGAVTGYIATPDQGSATVAGASVSAAVTWAMAYAVTITEQGLPSGTSWSVTLGGNQQTSSSTTITFTVPNGSYPFTVGAVSGYGSSPSQGTIAVSGAAVAKTIDFAPPSSSSSSYLWIGLAIAVLLVVLLLIVVLWRRKRKAAPANAGQPGAPTGAPAPPAPGAIPPPPGPGAFPPPPPSSGTFPSPPPGPGEFPPPPP
jgi:hypothetical protein